MIKTVVFDIGMVLLGFDWPAYMKKLFDSEETAERVTRAMFGSSRWHELDRGVLSEEEMLGLFVSADPEYKEEILEAYRRVGECTERLEWPEELIDSIKARGYQVLFLSNMSEHVLAANPEAFEFTKHMDGGIFSCRVKMIKPDPGIYKALFDKYDLVPEECLFIDDQPDNIAAAKKLGMKTIRFESHEQLLADLDVALIKDHGHDKISVMCYGDSNTYAYDPYTSGRYPYGKRWTTLLAEKLGGRYEVIPEGLNGRTTAFDRMEEAWKNGISSLTACFGTHKPVEHIVIMLGTNDCIVPLGLSSEEIARGMEALVELVEEYAPQLQGFMPQITVVAPLAIKGDYLNSPFAYDLSPETMQKSLDIAPLYKDIAERHRCLFADATECVEVSFDCMHLTEKGHEQMAELIYETIRM